MDGQRDCWAETFLSIDPNWVAPVERAALLAVLPRRREMFESIGATAGELISAEETPLDERHTINHQDVGARIRERASRRAWSE